jgi:5-methylcytosine-specific restriction endonuclease McrA
MGGVKARKGRHPNSIATQFKARDQCSDCEIKLTSENKRNGRCVTCSKRASVARTLRWKARHPVRAMQTQRTTDRKRNTPARKVAGLLRLKEWIALNPLAVVQANGLKQQRRRARSATGRGLTKAEWEAQIEVFAGACGYCLRADVPMTKDHVIPLARGGAHEIENIAPACRDCNEKKQARGPLAML